MAPHSRGSSVPSRRRALVRLGGLLVLVGALVGAAAVPAGALVGSGAAYLTGREGAALPAQLRDPVLAQTTRVYAADGRTLITTFFDEDRQEVGPGQVAPVLRQAVVAAEDVRFYQHGGIDPRGVLRALVTDTRDGHADQGASTLTMQLVRNLLKDDPDLTPAQQEAAVVDTPARKLREAEYAVQLEQHLTKQQILQEYLNVVYFGDGAYGIEAASRRVFGVPASRLDLAQAALLAGIVQSPESDNPISGDRGRARDRQQYVLAAMAKAGMITPAQQAAAAGGATGLLRQLTAYGMRRGRRHDRRLGFLLRLPAPLVGRPARVRRDPRAA
jgi:membrane peptidoglycan carboxypeptidase